MNNFERKLVELYDFDVNNNFILEVVRVDDLGNPINPEPANLGPANPEPANLGPANPEQANPEPANPEAESDDDEEYYSDSGVEDEACLFEESEVVSERRKNITLNHFLANGIDRVYCVNVAYVIVKCVDGDNRNLCHACFCIHQNGKLRE